MEYENDTVLVTPAPGKTAKQIAAVLGIEEHLVEETDAGFMEATLPSGMSVETAVETLEDHKDVAAAQPDFIYRLQDELDSESLSDQVAEEAGETASEEGSSTDSQVADDDSPQISEEASTETLTANREEQQSDPDTNQLPGSDVEETDGISNEEPDEAQESATEATTDPVVELQEETTDDNGDTPEADAGYTPNDPYITEQWALTSINAYKAWHMFKQGTVKPTAIALIDDGIETTHEDLVGNLQTDAEGDLVAYNAFDDSDDVSQRTGSKHGTHVAGIVAAEANNGIGVAGVSLNQKIIPIKVFDDGGTTKSSTLAKAFTFVMEHASAYNIRVINCSVGGIGNSSQVDEVLKNSIDKAYDEFGIAVVCSAGNKDSGHDVPNYNYPSDYSRVVAVINLAQKPETEDGVERAVASNYNRTLDDGTIEMLKDIAAPGAGIYSTIPGGDYGTSSGTSMAAPCVSGVLAMMFAVNPKLEAEQAIGLLYGTARDIDETGFDAETGYGEVDAAAAVEAATTAEGSFEPVPVPDPDHGESDDVPESEPDAPSGSKNEAADASGKASVPTPLYVIGATKMPVSSTSIWKLKNATMKVVSGKGVVSIAKDGVTVKAKKKGTAKVAIYNKAGKKVKTQKIKVYQFSGAYMLSSAKASKLCVSVKNDSKRVNAAAVVAKKAGKTSQAVKLIWDNGYYRLKMMGSKKYLAVKSASKKQGAPIVQVKKSSSKAQQWKISVDKKNRLTFTNRKSGKVLRIQGKIASGAHIIQSTSTAHLRAKWLPTR